MLSRFVTWIIGESKPVHVDGALYVMIGVFGVVQAMLSQDDVYKYLNPYVVFYFKAGAGIGLAAVSALKMFRSNSFSVHEKEVKETKDKAEAKEDAKHG